MARLTDRHAKTSIQTLSFHQSHLEDVIEITLLEVMELVQGADNLKLHDILTWSSLGSGQFHLFYLYSRNTEGFSAVLLPPFVSYFQQRVGFQAIGSCFNAIVSKAFASTCDHLDTVSVYVHRLARTCHHENQTGKDNRSCNRVRLR